ncbi:hypothetical protein [Paradesulfitobacterium ferrireducens]|uniref:hypothetical protein n=1 Tax=Paradesulfitobacterium ferrireducens TaxID=2816476 RepID=UPI001A8D31C9|nr:hypothetical protein [Paradesulfitobacterium ferrireducens]
MKVAGLDLGSVNTKLVILENDQPIFKKTMLIFSGGGAYYQPLVHLLEKQLSAQVVVPPEPELTAALGAALTAKMD